MSTPTSVDEYLAALPDDRRQAIEAIRRVFLDNLDPEFEEGIQYQMIGYYVPHHVFPSGYHCDPTQPLPFAAVGSQKNHMVIHLMCLYQDPDLLAWFTTEWAGTDKKLDMGKACVRFKKLEHVALDALAALLKRITAKQFVAQYQKALASSKNRPTTSRGKAQPASNARKSSRSVRKSKPGKA